jgi:nucleoid-associated protein YgaU
MPSWSYLLRMHRPAPSRIALWALGSMLIVGCSIFGKSSDAPSPKSSEKDKVAAAVMKKTAADRFRKIATASNNPVPVPVEIAEDIDAISNESKVLAVPPSGGADGGDQAELGQVPIPQEEASESVDLTTGEHKKGKKRVGKTERYKVRRGDTLMKISFDKYGNMFRWREIYNSNKKVIQNPNLIYTGQVLVINGVQYVVISKQGVPYLIKKGDTLKKIAAQLYGSEGKWKVIWKNNPELLRNPRQLFAGFTLYYNPKSTVPVPSLRDPAESRKAQ